MLTQAELTVRLRNKFPWISRTVDPPSLDDKISNALQHWINDPGALQYDPLQFENLLNDVSKLLDRCLAYRREFNELAGSAFRLALEYELYQNQRAILEELDAASWLEEVRKIEGFAQRHAAEQFEAEPQASLSAGFGALARAAEKVSFSGAEAEQHRQELVRNRWKIFSEYQEALELRHTTPGHPLHFAERAERVEGLLLEDVVEAFAKLAAAVEGTRTTFGLPPKGFVEGIQQSISPLDEFVHRVRRLIQRIEIYTQGEHIHEQIHLEPFPVQTEWKELTWGNFNPQSRGRLRALGVSLILRNMAEIPNSEFLWSLIQFSMNSPFAVPSITTRMFTLTGATTLRPGFSSNWYSGWEVSNLPINPIKFKYLFMGAFHPNEAIPSIALYNAISFLVFHFVIAEKF